ncbi:MAG: right-handed parallel beta-helix repeat-containing protein [Anaerolineaceae bacterium]
MKPGYLTRTFLGVVAVLTLLAAFLFPIPVYAGTPDGAGPHEPPPPQTPANDLGLGSKKSSPAQSGVLTGNSSGTSSSTADAPYGAASAGTPLLLASQLSINALAPVSANLSLPNQVKFCPQSGPDFFNAACQERTTIEDIITYIKSLDDASGVIYVGQNYSTGATLPQPGLVFDQNTFKNAGPSLATGLDMHGGYDFNVGTQTGIKTVLNQPVTIQNFNAVSHFSMDMFQFNISGYAAGDPAAAAVNVIGSSHVTLNNLDIQESGKGSGLVATQSNDLTLQKITLSDSGGGQGVDISRTTTILLDQVNSTSTSKTGYGAFLSNNKGSLTITASQFDGSTNAGIFVLNQTGDINLDFVTASSNKAFGAAFLFGTGGLTISSSQFNGNTDDGLQISSQNGAISLAGVNSANNGSNGARILSSNSPFSILASQFNDNGAIGLNLTADTGQVRLDAVTANGNTLWGTLINSQSGGDVNVFDSQFDNNGPAGLSATVQGGMIALLNVSASSNVVSGVSLFSFVPLNSPAGILVAGGDFSNNGNQGMTAGSNGGIYIFGGTYMSNKQLGLALNGSNAISLTGVQAGSNGAYGAQVSFGGDVQVSTGFFNGNGTGGLDLEYAFTPPPPGGTSPASFTVTLDQVQAVRNGDYGALVTGGENSTYSPVDLFITNSNFDQNRGTLHSGLTINTFGSVNMDNVSASGNAASGADITSLDLFINNSRFNSNGGYGLVLAQTGNSALVNVKACFNRLGPVDLLGEIPFIQNLDTKCPAQAPDNFAPVAPVENGLPWQTIMVFSDVNQGTAMLSCQMGTTFVYLQKSTPPAADYELVRVELPPCIVPEGSVASFQGLAKAGLPASLPDGATFLGPAFELALSTPDGGSANPGGALALHFNLPGGFSLPAGKKLAALWFDPAAKKWVELPTFAGPNMAFAFPVKTGVFVLVVK